MMRSGGGGVKVFKIPEQIKVLEDMYYEGLNPQEFNRCKLFLLNLCMQKVPKHISMTNNTDDDLFTEDEMLLVLNGLMGDVPSLVNAMNKDDFYPDESFEDIMDKLEQIVAFITMEYEVLREYILLRGVPSIIRLTDEYFVVELR